MIGLGTTRYRKMELRCRFSQEEYLQRMNKLQQSVRQCGFDVFIVSTYKSMVYLLGLTHEPTRRPFSVLVWADKEPELICPVMEGEHLSGLPSMSSVMTYEEFPAPPGKGWKDALLQKLGTQSLRVGVEHSDLILFFQQNRPVWTVNLQSLVDDQMMIKSEEEIRMVRFASRYADLGVEYVLNAAYVGCSELELFKLGDNVKKRMALEVGFDPLLSGALVGAWMGPVHYPHDIPGIDRIMRPDTPNIALSLPMVYGMKGEMEEIFFTSDLTTEQRRRYGVMIKAQQIALSMVQPGASCGSIDVEVRRFFTDAGFETNILHGVGHGIGYLSFHNTPYIADGSEHVLRPGMVVTIEPGLYFKGDGSYRRSVMVLVKEDGYELLSERSVPKHPIILPAWNGRVYRRVKGLFTRTVMGF